MRSTKIVATLGPASDPLIESLITAGVNVFRINFSHGNHSEHAQRIELVRKFAKQHAKHVAVLADLQGPKIRIKGFGAAEQVELIPGESFTIDSALGDADGNATRVGTSYLSLASELNGGDCIVLGDGLIELEVQRCTGTQTVCRVTLGGPLRANQGINKRGGGLSAPALTEKDEQDLAFACAQQADYIAVSFPRSAADMQQARGLIDAQGANCSLIAKLERAELVADEAELTDLILASDAVMVARGDLGIEIGDAALMGVQKNIIKQAQRHNRCVITATQMMESMIHNPRPTRAEVMDVANAVVDGSDAVMLSGETAVGEYPVECVNSMVEVIKGAEATIQAQSFRPQPRTIKEIDDGMATAAMSIAGDLENVRAVACLTSSGNTPKLMSRSRSPLPIYALADNPQALAKVALYRGVHPVLFDADHIPYDKINAEVVSWLQRDGVVTQGDRIIMSKGDHRDAQGGTNTLKVLEVN